MTSHPSILLSKRSGFTLIEVSLAVPVLGLGLMAAFGLFPAGVRQNEESTADTRAALFADFVLNGMHANAAAVTNWGDWKDEATKNFLNTRILGNGPDMPCPYDNSGLPKEFKSYARSSEVHIDWPFSSAQAPKPRLRYKLTIDAAADYRVYTATLEV